MPEPDFIRIDGVEYGRVYGPDRDWAMKDYRHVVLTPKRKQTGWVCRACKVGLCVRAVNPAVDRAPDRGVYTSCSMRKFEPYYGKVTEE